jgi:archaellum component FlaC
MTDWETTKIKKDVKEQAKDDERTYTEIMAAGLENETQEPEFDAVASKEDIEQLKDQLSMANEPGVEVNVGEIFEKLDGLEGRMKDLKTEVNTLKEALQKQ